MTIHELLQAAGLTANDEIPIWDVDGTGEPTKKITAQQLAQAVVTLANLVSGVKGDNESAYRHGNINLTPANIGALPDTTFIPSKTSDLTNDSGFLTGSTGVIGVKGNAESSYRKGNVNLTPANIGAKPTQTAVADPTASGNSISFIDSITQDAQGVVTPTKKSVPNATTTAAGLMSATDKAKLNGLDMLGFYIDNSGYICQRIGSDTNG